MPQRTPLQAYKHVLKALDAGKVDPELMQQSGGCEYRMKMDGKIINCGVGSLFNRAQLKDIAARDADRHSIGALGHDIGWNNLTEVTGLDEAQLRALQSKHDAKGFGVTPGHNKAFRKYVVGCIEELS